tara:strand:- start:623 stop:1273 length:651 start_codon:yes stop_codon:yes gene_type:complete
MSKPVLEIQALSFSYKPDKLCLDNVNIKIEEGEKVSILGPSGCGKSTLLRLIAGFEKPQKGIIKLDDQEVFAENKFLPPHKRNVGLVVQEKALFPHLSIAENIGFGVRKSPDNKVIVNELLELFRIEDLKSKYPHEISGGEQQRVAFARSMAPSPKFLMLDEPFSALDEKLKETLYNDLLEIFLKKNFSVLLVTHDENEAKIMTDKQIKILDGRIS